VTVVYFETASGRLNNQERLNKNARVAANIMAAEGVEVLAELGGQLDFHEYVGGSLDLETIGSFLDWGSYVGSSVLASYGMMWATCACSAFVVLLWI